MTYSQEREGFPLQRNGLDSTSAGLWIMTNTHVIRIDSISSSIEIRPRSWSKKIFVISNPNDLWRQSAWGGVNAIY